MSKILDFDKWNSSVNENNINDITFEGWKKLL